MFSPNRLQEMVHDAQSEQDRKFNRLIERLDTIIELLQKEYKLMATVQDLTAQVAAESTIDDSIIALLNGIVAQLSAAQASGDPAALDVVLAGIKANSDKISAAVVANTPVVVVPVGTTTVPTGTTVTTAPATGSTQAGVTATPAVA
jgi:hypothetical protein